MSSNTVSAGEASGMKEYMSNALGAYNNEEGISDVLEGIDIIDAEIGE